MPDLGKTQAHSIRLPEQQAANLLLSAGARGLSLLKLFSEPAFSMADVKARPVCLSKTQA
jgi:hypothetical protein